MSGSALPVGEQFPAPAKLLPHAGEMCLLEAVVTADSESCSCLATIPHRGLLVDSRGEVSSSAAIEYMAQCAAVFAGLSAGEAPPKIGLLLGTRKMSCYCEAFYPGQVLLIRASLGGTFGSMCTFTCSIIDQAEDSILAEAVLNVFVTDQDPSGAAE